MSSPELRRDEGLEVAVARVGRPGRRARWAAIAWAAALVALVTVAIGDRAVESEPSRVTAAIPGPHADPGPAATAVPPRRPIVRVAAPHVRTPGEDGLMGSLVFDFEPGDLFVPWAQSGQLPY